MVVNQGLLASKIPTPLQELQVSFY
ncbi:hypothetical protein A2U01_0109941, partial [Trifolium medium]|nr:hypothetical protein [Trifolium medium]